MTSSYSIAGLAGVISALLFATATAGNMLAVPLFYLAPLPIFLVGFGWGLQPALVAGAVGALVLLPLSGPVFGLGYAVTLAAPAGFLTYLALLSRDTGQQASSDSGEQADVEWYPPGKLVIWAAVIAGTLTALTIPVFGMDAESYYAALQTMIEETVLKDVEANLPTPLDADQMLALTAFLVRALPAVSSIIWFLAVVLNMWAASRLVELIGRSLRPRSRIEAMVYPQEFSLAFVAILFLSMMGGMFGIIATGFAGAFIMAFVLLGLAVIHSLSHAATRLRPILLSMLYMGLVLFGWIVLIIATIGIAEPTFKLREKFANPATPTNRGGG